jgi:hypothetical protein
LYPRAAEELVGELLDALEEDLPGLLGDHEKPRAWGGFAVTGGFALPDFVSRFQHDNRSPKVKSSDIRSAAASREANRKQKTKPDTAKPPKNQA